jgi:peptide/nickel transport system ATP-binding protein
MSQAASASASPDQRAPAQPLLVADGLRKHYALRSGGAAWAGLFDRFGLAGRFGLSGGAATRLRAVDGVSFHVAQGETLGVVGESGCGKSTTARLVARLIRPDAGTLVFDGDDLGTRGGAALKAYRRQVQMVFQDASLNPRLPVGAAVAYGPGVHGVPAAAARERALDLLARVGLDPRLYAQRYPHELSGGQRQRVNLARALAFEPRLLILDEAVAALDKSVQAQVLNLLQELKAERRLTYLFISHDLHVVHYMADRVLVMYLGVVVETGPVEALYRAPRHPYTRALLASVPALDPARRTQQPPLAGDPPSAVQPPSGCRFRDRCPQAQAVCAAAVPVLRESTPGHWAACHLDEPGVAAT